MKEKELKLYREILNRKHVELLGIAEDTLSRMSEGKDSFPDPVDRALSESSSSIELRKRDRERKLIQKIKTALKKMEEGTWKAALGHLRTIGTAILGVRTWGYSRRSQGQSGLRRPNVGCWG